MHEMYGAVLRLDILEETFVLGQHKFLPVPFQEHLHPEVVEYPA